MRRAGDVVVVSAGFHRFRRVPTRPGHVKARRFSQTDCFTHCVMYKSGAALFSTNLTIMVLMVQLYSSAYL